MTRRALRTPVWITLATALAVLSGCRKGPGSACKGAESTCSDKTTALACRDGKFVAVGCAGPLGCSKFQDHANCDDSIASGGDPCMATGDDEYACTPDRKRALTCKNGTFERYLECRGKAGCALVGPRVSCDASVAVKGDPCEKQDQVACSEDRKAALICREHKFEVHRHCRGKQGCSTGGEMPPVCDETLAMDDDPCGQPGRIVCSVDGKFELACQGGRYVRSRACRKTGCVVTNSAAGAIDCP